MPTIHVYFHDRSQTRRRSKDETNSEEMVRRVAKVREIQKQLAKAFIAPDVERKLKSDLEAAQLEVRKLKGEIELRARSKDAFNAVKEAGVARREGWTLATLKAYLIRHGVESDSPDFAAAIREFEKGTKDAGTTHTPDWEEIKATAENYAETGASLNGFAMWLANHNIKTSDPLYRKGKDAFQRAQGKNGEYKDRAHKPTKDATYRGFDISPIPRSGGFVIKRDGLVIEDDVATMQAAKRKVDEIIRLTSDRVHKPTKDLGGPYLAAFNQAKVDLDPKYVNVLRAMLTEMDRGADEVLAFRSRHFGASQQRVKEILAFNQIET